MTTSSDPDEIRAEIERTRSRLSDDVDTLTDEASPKRIAQRQVGRTRDALTGVKDRVMGRAADATDSVTSTASGVKDSVTGTASGVKDRVSGSRSAIQEKTEGNPLAAGLIAFGAGLLVASLFRSSRAEERLAGRAKENLQPVVEEVRDIAKESAENLREPAQQAVQSVKETAGDAANQVKETGSSAADDVRTEAQSAKDDVQESRHS